tara:strand:- start:1780 stop:2040 length:261 start_codon:yes stop_codon:yes gene_type:complete
MLTTTNSVLLLRHQQRNKVNIMTNWFNTLSEALEAENLSHAWDMRPIAYNQTLSCTYDNGTKYGYYVSIYRDERGMYERPIHYKRG